MTVRAVQMLKGGWSGTPAAAPASRTPNTAEDANGLS